MRKLTQNILPGETLTFPSCKTFVYLRSEHAVSFKFITMFNKIDRTIDNFQDSFSVTANTYFLRVEITSDNAQELSCILIEDTGIDYTPITGDVFISNDEDNKIPVVFDEGCATVINSAMYPVQVGNYYPNLNCQGVDYPKYWQKDYRGSYPFSFWNTSNMGGTGLQVWAPILNGGTYRGFIERISIIPTINTYLELWYKYFDGLGDTHSFTSYKTINDHQFIDSDSLRSFGHKNVTRASLLLSDTLRHTYPLLQNVMNVYEPKFPIEVQVKNVDYTDKRLNSYCSISTKDVCEYEIYVEGTMFQLASGSRGFYFNHTNFQPSCGV